MPAPPIRQVGNEGEYSFEPAVRLDFSAPLAPGGDDWATFLQRSYDAVRNGLGASDPYGLYWNDVYPAIAQGDAYWVDPETGQLPAGVAPPSPQFLAARGALGPEAIGQAQENLRAIQYTSPGSPFGDQFFTALLGLGLATGGAAAFGGFAAPAAGAAAAPAAAEAGTAAGVAAPVAATGTTAGGGGLALGVGPGLGTAATLGPISAEGAGVAGGLGAAGGIGAGVAAPSAATATGVLGTGLTASQLARLAGAGVSLGTALAGGGRGPETRTTSSVSFAPETRSLIGGIELPLVAGAIDEQGAQLGPLLTGTPFRSDVAARFGGVRATNAVQSAVRRGARATGVRDLGPAFEETGVLQPQLLGALRQLALQRGAQNTTAVAPGFAPFLAPTASSRTEGGGPSAFETGFNLASTLGSAYVSTLK